MKSAFAALALASLFTSPAWAQDPTRTEIAAGGPTVQLAAPDLPCRGEAFDAACASEGLFPPTYDVRREFTAITPGSTGGGKRLSRDSDGANPAWAGARPCIRGTRPP
jgi:hypothetical protein